MIRFDQSFNFGVGSYTDDSNRPMAAVHAGLISAGQKAIIRQVYRGNSSYHATSTRNGVTTTEWSSDWCTVDLYLVQVLN